MAICGQLILCLFSSTHVASFQVYATMLDYRFSLVSCGGQSRAEQYSWYRQWKSLIVHNICHLLLTKQNEVKWATTTTKRKSKQVDCWKKEAQFCRYYTRGLKRVICFSFDTSGLPAGGTTPHRGLFWSSTSLRSIAGEGTPTGYYCLT